APDYAEQGWRRRVVAAGERVETLCHGLLSVVDGDDHRDGRWRLHCNPSVSPLRNASAFSIMARIPHFGVYPIDSWALVLSRSNLHRTGARYSSACIPVSSAPLDEASGYGTARGPDRLHVSPTAASDSNAQRMPWATSRASTN